MGWGSHFETELKKHIEEAFGSNLTARQLWAMVKLAKHVRRFCRSNNALNPCLGRLFPYATFRDVTKQTADGKPYKGLHITVTATGDSQEDASNSDE